MMNIGVVQFESQLSKEKNITKAIHLIKEAHKKGAEIICLQELFMTEYFCFVEDEEKFDLADDLNNSHFIKDLMKCTEELRIVLIASCFEKRTSGIYHNTTIVIENGVVMGKYRKQHIPDDPGYYEKYYFTPGDTGNCVIKTSKGNLGILICWDQWFPEAARMTALKGADVLFYPTAIGWTESDSKEIKEEEIEAWKIMHQSHAIANGIPVVAVNRIGTENGLRFWGNSFVTNAFGKIVTECDVLNEEVKVVSIDRKETDFYRKRWPFFRDRRVDAYGSLLKIFDDE